MLEITRAQFSNLSHESLNNSRDSSRLTFNLRSSKLRKYNHQLHRKSSNPQLLPLQTKSLR